MKKLTFVLLTAAFAACESEYVMPPENFLAEAESYASWADEKVGKQLSYRSISEYTLGDNIYSARVGYIEDKPAVVMLSGLEGTTDKWWLYPDSATGKLLYFKEETTIEGRAVRNRIAYRGDSVAYALSTNDPYVSADPAQDFRLQYAAVSTAMQNILAAVEEDVKVLSPEANAARRENAQFFATGGKNSWMLTINPSKSTVTFIQTGAEERKFGYDRPRTGPSNESIYTFASLNGKIEVSIFSKPCNSSDNRKYPYTVTVKDDGKTVSGCGVLLQ